MSSSEEDEISVNEAPVVKVVKKKKKKKKKDPNAPKRGLSSFLLYSNANRSRIKEENPEAKFGDIVSLHNCFLCFNCNGGFLFFVVLFDGACLKIRDEPCLLVCRVGGRIR